MNYFKKITLIALVVVVILISFFKQYTSFLQDIESTAKTKEASINRHIDMSKEFVDLITIYGDDFLQGETNDSELYSLLAYDAAGNTYNLDAIRDTKYQTAAGSLTGKGPIPESGINRKEINLALHFNPLFSSIYNKLPELTWLYYTSKNNFVNIYPWVSSDEFRFSQALQEEKFFTDVTPENDPLRESVWTPVYLDHAGKGLMVTLTSPIYNGDAFMGSVSLDFTNEQLSDTINSKYKIYLIDNTDCVIASNDSKADTDIYQLNAMLKCSPDEADKIKEVKSNTIQKLGGYYIYTVDFTNAPWKMIFRVSVWLIIGKSLLETIPVLVICLLLLFTYLEVEKRKKAEIRLNKSLVELTSYQNLLENAAKYDFLTSSVNRRGLMDIFHSLDAKTPVLFIIGDIDNFKKFNDTYGHTAGDKILMEIAKLMQSSIETKDVVCRWGGEEFLIMLLNKSYKETLDIAETIRKNIENMAIPWENSIELRATITFGIAEYDFSKPFNENIAKADKALYYGKSHGRNQVNGYQDCIDESESGN